MAAPPVSVLYLDTDPLGRGWVRAALANEQSGVNLTEVTSRQEFKQRLVTGSYDLVLSDLNIAGLEGVEVLDFVHATAPLTPVIIITRSGSEEIAVEALKKGAADYIIKSPEHIETLPQAIRLAMENGPGWQAQNQTKAALKHSRARWESLVQNAPNYIAIVDRAGILQFINKFQAGFEPDKVIGTPTYDYIAPEYHQLVREKIESVFETGQMVYYEIEAQGPGGQPVWYETRVGPLLIDGRVAFATLISSDITDRKHQQQILLDTKNILEKTFASLSEAVFVVNPADRTIVTCNPAVEAVFGYTVAELIGQNTKMLHVSPQEYARFDQLSRPELNRHGVFSTEFNMRRKGGQIICTENTVTTLTDATGWMEGVVSVVRDITGRKLQEQSLQRYADRLKILHEIDRAILAAQSVEEIAVATLERLAQLVWCTRADISLYDPDQEAVEKIANYPPDVSKFGVGTRLPLAQTFLNIEALRAGQLHQVEDYQARPNIPAPLKAVLAEEGLRASLVVPLIAGGELIGMLGLGRREPGPFAPEDIEIVREVADSLAITMRQTQLLAAERDQRLRAETLREVTLGITSHTDIDAVLAEILSQVARIVPYKAANIALLEGEILRTVGWRGYDQFGSEATIARLRQHLADFPGHRQALLEKEPRIVYDTRQDPTWVTLPETAWIRSNLLLPIVAQGEILGELRLDSDVPHDFSPDDASRLFVLAQTIAIALNKARLYNQIQRHAAELEQRVAERTAELEKTHRQQAALEERQRLARDLHDAVSQTLFSASLLAEAIPRLWARYPEKAQQSLEQLRHLNRGALAEMRILLAELRPETPIDTNLAELLRQLTHALAGRTQVDIELQMAGDPEIGADVQTVFYRIAQESLNNIARHARASRVTVRLICQPDVTTLTIADDGRGFDPRQVKAGHLGLNIMRERAETVGASMTLKSQPGKGTEVSVSWPASAKASGT